MKCTQEERSEIANLVYDRRAAFSLNGEIGHITNFEHRIPIGTAAPIKQCPYRLPLWGAETVENCLNEMLRAKVIVPCEPGEETEWASPVVLVKKRDGNIRFCCDF